MSDLPQLTLYSRSYCHLCADMLAAIEALRDRFQFELTVLDVDDDAALEARYNEQVPVLAAAERELCHHFIDTQKVCEYLAGFR